MPKYWGEGVQRTKDSDKKGHEQFAFIGKTFKTGYLYHI